MAKNGNREAGTRELFWREHVAGWEKSGQSVRGYCRAQGLTESGFHFWKRELKRRDAVRGREGWAVSGEFTKQALFVEMRPARVEAVVPSAIEMVLSGERVVRVHPGFDAATLAGVVRLLEGLGC